MVSISNTFDALNSVDDAETRREREESKTFSILVINFHALCLKNLISKAFGKHSSSPSKFASLRREKYSKTRICINKKALKIVETFKQIV